MLGTDDSVAAAAAAVARMGAGRRRGQTPRSLPSACLLRGAACSAHLLSSLSDRRSSRHCRQLRSKASGLREAAGGVWPVATGAAATQAAGAALVVAVALAAKAAGLGATARTEPPLCWSARKPLRMRIAYWPGQIFMAVLKIEQSSRLTAAVMHTQTNVVVYHASDRTRLYTWQYAARGKTAAGER